MVGTSVLVLAMAGCNNDPAKGKTQVTAAAPLASTAAAAGAVKYGFSNADSRVEFVGAKVTRKHDGSFQLFTGTVNLVDNDPTKSSVTAEIDVGSLKSDEEKLTGHLKSGDLLDVAKFPKATFVSKKVEPAGEGKAKITGDLTLRGVTKEVTIDAAYVGGGADPWGGNRTGFTGTTKFALADYGITFNLGPASKEVELTLEVEGVEKK